jgi:hypothetical protein
MEQVLDVYKRPYDENNPVVCMDESPEQLIETVQKTDMRPGQDARVDYEYIRHGVANIFLFRQVVTEPVEVLNNRGKRAFERQTVSGSN